MLKLSWIAGTAMISLGSLAFAQQQMGPREAAVDGTSLIFYPGSPAGAQGRAFTSTLTRADVKAELARARASGELDAWREHAVEGTSVMTAQAGAGAQGRAFTSPGLTRAQVKAELESARAKGEVDRYGPEHGGRN